MPRNLEAHKIARGRDASGETEAWLRLDARNNGIDNFMAFEDGRIFARFFVARR